MNNTQPFNENPIRVLQAVSGMNMGGIESFIMNIYRGIDRNRVQFDFLMHTNSNCLFNDEILALGGRIYTVPNYNPIHQKKYCDALDAFFEQHKEYKTVHSHRNELSMFVLRSAEKAGIPVRIAHSHSISVNNPLTKPFKDYARKKLPRYCTHRFACSNEAGEYLFGTGSDFTVINNPVNTREFGYKPQVREEMRSQLGIEDGAPVFGHIGSFRDVKNHEFLLKVFSDILTVRPDAVLLLAGDGELRNAREQQAKELGIDGSVRFLGIRTDAARIMQAMDCFVFPSKYEGFGMVLAEAQAAGLPCLASTGVPPKTALTALVEFMSLQESENQWAQKALGLLSAERRSYAQEIKAAGYDTEERAKWLEGFYVREQNKF